MVQTSRVSGLAHVYDNLVGFDGCEFYFFVPPEDISQKTYEDIIFHFEQCSVLGIRKFDRSILFNPLPTTRLEKGDEIILIAEDDSTINYLDEKLPVTLPPASSIELFVRETERPLIVGWSQKTQTVVSEYCKYLSKGSEIVIVVNKITDSIRNDLGDIKINNPDIAMQLVESKTYDQEIIQKFKPELYSNIVILTPDSGDAELRDSETIAILLEFRNYFKHLKSENSHPQLITEVADSENIEVIQKAGVRDFLISNQFVSKMYAQCSEEPDTLKLYDDLFSPEGSEVYLKPIELYLSTIPNNISFGALCASASRRKESCFGIKIKREENEQESNYGIHINPNKSDLFSIEAGDTLIVLAEDDR